MTDPKGKTNADKHADAVASAKETRQKIELLEAQEKKHLKSYATLVEKYDKTMADIRELVKVKDIVELSETAKTHLIDVYVSTKYNRHDDIETRFMKKGTAVEKDSMTIYSAYNKDYFVKNTEQLSNAYIKGTPDIWIKKSKGIIELKSSWDAFTFFRNLGKEINKLYYWQCQGYIDLTDSETARLAYCLVDTPEHLIDAEASRLRYKIPPSQLEEAIELIKKQLKFQDIPFRERIIEFQILRNDSDIQNGYKRVDQGREFLQRLDTEATWRALNTELR